MIVENQPLQKKSETRSRTPWRSLLVLLLLVGALLAYFIYTGLVSRAQANTALSRKTLALAVPVVRVVHPRLEPAAQEIVVPGNIQAFKDTPIWARASGYLKAWYADIGTHVKAGQLLAVIESPETDQQLQQALQDLATAQANLKLSEITAARYRNLIKTDSVSQQDVDTAVQDAAAKTAAVKSAQANVARLRQLVAYEEICAPFDGVITERNIDVGALVDAGSNSPGKELFHISALSTLRVYVNVPEIDSRAAKPGVAAFLTLAEFPGRKFPGKVVRNAGAIDPASRTLLVEVDVKNPKGELLPGSYASVHLKLPASTRAMTIPENALLFRSEGLRVAVVRNGRAELVPIGIGRDFGDEVEVVSGLTPEDSVIVNPSDSIVSGEQVQAE